MKILDISPKVVLPPNTGSRVRMWNLLRHLSQVHEVRQFSQQRGRGGLREHVREVWVTSAYCEIQYSHPAVSVLGNFAEAPRISAPPLRGAGLEIARPSRLRSLFDWADVIVVEFPWQFAYCHRNRAGTPIVLSTHNVEAERFASVARAERGPGARHRWAGWIERVERRAVLDADLVLAVSEEDREALIRRYGPNPDRLVVIPNGAEMSRFTPADRSAKVAAKHHLGLPLRPTVLYTGSNTAPNRAGLHWVRRLAERAPHLSFVVVGELSAGLSGEPFFAPGVVNDMAPFLQAADMAVCPIEYGGGTKIKLLESLAAGLPTVAFEETVQGLNVLDGEHLRIVPKDEELLIAALDEFVADTAFADRIGSEAHQYVRANHDWLQIAGRLDEVLTSLVGREQTGFSSETAPETPVGSADRRPLAPSERD